MGDKFTLDYIWYCPRSSCQSIVLKTDKPFISDNAEYMCKHCNEIIDSKRLMDVNEHNLKRYLRKNKEKMGKNS